LTRAKWLIIGAMIILCVVVFFLLRDTRSSSGLSADEFADVYVELSLASQTLSGDSAGFEDEKSRIFERAGVTQMDMDEFVQRMNRKPDEWAEVWKKVMERLEQKRQRLKSP
jgi:hypothetical protein